MVTTASLGPEIGETCVIYGPITTAGTGGTSTGRRRRKRMAGTAKRFVTVTISVGYD
jgi:hypothetical protein